MSYIRLTKEFSFEMAHALWNYDGSCRNIHGHSYRLSVTVKGQPIEEKGNVKLGMVLDFGVLKEIVQQEIIKPFDHSVVISNEADHSWIKQSSQMFEKTILTAYQPTCENMLIDFAKKIQLKLPVSIQLVSIKLAETANSYAEWFAADQG